MASATTEVGSKFRVVVGLGSCGIAAGAQDVKDTLERLLAEKKLPATLGVTGCNGACHREPIVEIYEPEGVHTIYAAVTPDGSLKLWKSTSRRGSQSWSGPSRAMP